MAGVQVGVGYIDIKPDMTGFSRELRADMNRDVAAAGAAGGRTLGTSFLGSFKGVVGGLVAAGAVKGAFSFLDDAIEAASELNEVVSASNTIFGESAVSVENWAKGASDNIGLSQRAATQAAAGFGNMFSQLGLGSDQAADLSTSIVELGVDFASFFRGQVSQEEVLNAQAAAFRGEYDALQRFLPLINAATVEQKALEMTGKGLTKELTAQEKALAVNALMFEGAGAALGDYERTSGTLAGQQQEMNAKWEDAQAILGQELLPIMTDVVSYLAEDGIPGFLKFIDVVGEGFADAAGFFIGAMADIMSVIAAGLEKIDSITPGLEGVPEALRENVKGAREMEAALHDVHFELDGVADGTDKAVSSATLFGSILNFVNEGLGETIPRLNLHAEATKDVDKATRDAASAERDLADARGDYNDLLARGPVDEAKVADARQTLADATRSAAGAERDLANAQERYDDALVASQVLHGFDTAQDDLADASDGLADAQDNVAAAHERAAEAAAELRAAQAGDPDYQDQLADARDRVADATDSVADANEHVVETSGILLDTLKQVSAALDDVGTKADTAATKVRPLLDPNGLMVGGVLGAVPLDDAFIDAYGAGAYEPHPDPWGGPRQPPQPDPALTPSSTLNTFNMIFNEKVDPIAVANEVSWIL